MCLVGCVSNDDNEFGGEMNDNLFHDVLMCALVGLLFGCLYMGIMEAVDGLQHK